MFHKHSQKRLLVILEIFVKAYVSPFRNISKNFGISPSKSIYKNKSNASYIVLTIWSSEGVKKTSSRNLSKNTLFKRLFKSWSESWIILPIIIFPNILWISPRLYLSSYFPKYCSLLFWVTFPFSINCRFKYRNNYHRQNSDFLLHRW